jgi:hypothetical protein
MMMSAIASTALNSRNSLVRSILIGAVIVGMLQLIIQEFVVFSLIANTPFILVVQYLASGAIGNAAFEGGLATALLGVFFHALVSLAVAGVFVLSAVRIALLRRHVVVGSLLYGFGVFVVRNMIVLPLSAAPPLPPPAPGLFIEMIVEHTLVVGLPLGLLMRGDAMRR